MARRVAAIVLALMLTPAVVHAQEATFTIAAASADVHKGPSIVTPVIGHVSRGAVLPISRNLGSWVRIAWPSAPDGVGFVHVTMGRLSANAPEPSATPGPSPSVSSPSSPSSPKPAAASTPAAVSAQPPARTPGKPGVGVQGAQGVTSISHVIGVGALVQSARGFGATGRAWHADRFGLEFRLTRSTMTSDAAGRMTSVEFEPRFVYALFDHVSNYVWVRPYLGSGVTFSHRTLTGSSPATTADTTDNRAGFDVFGGGELTFASATPFGLSAELGYRPSSTPFPGFETDRVRLSIAGHWYIK
jgi:hypothetical protein